MFRRKRLHTLARKVLKFSKENQIDRQIKQVENWSKISDVFSRYLARYLDEKQLRILLQSLENKGGIHTDCILLPQDENLLKITGLSQVNVLFCKILRWPDLKSSSSLKNLIHCTSHDSSMLCTNPYHYSKIIFPESRKCNENEETVSTQSQTLEIVQTQNPEAEGNDDENERHLEPNANNPSFQNTSTGYSSASSEELLHSQAWSRDCCDSWCSIAYWEIKRRVGRVFDAYNECVNVFYELPQGDGLCIGLFQQVDQTDYVNKVRKHIGYGFQLTLEQNGIWIYNRSDYCIFISSPVTQSESSSEQCMETLQPDVKRIPSGYCLHVVDFRKSYNIDKHQKSLQLSRGPCDLFCIRVSFAKGWGEKYTRQYITSCPCWTEIYLKESCLARMKLL